GVVVRLLGPGWRRLWPAAVAAEALRKSGAITTGVLHAVSHDVRSPLPAIRAASEGLYIPSLRLSPEEREELFETIRLELRRLERLVDNLLDLSRLEAGPGRRRPELWTGDRRLVCAPREVGAEAQRRRTR